MEYNCKGLHGNPLLLIRLIASHCDVINDIPFVTAAILDFYLQVKNNVRIMIPLCFLYFKTWLCIPKLSFYDKY